MVDVVQGGPLCTHFRNRKRPKRGDPSAQRPHTTTFTANSEVPNLPSRRVPAALLENSRVNRELCFATRGVFDEAVAFLKTRNSPNYEEWQSAR